MMAAWVQLSVLKKRLSCAKFRANAQRGTLGQFVRHGGRDEGNTMNNTATTERWPDRMLGLLL